MKIATWNINGIKARQHNLLQWLKAEQPDIVALQEIKCETEKFPQDIYAEIEALGYNLAIYGQKSFNGVALLSRLPFDEINKGLYSGGSLSTSHQNNYDDPQARFIEGVVSAGESVLRVACLYLPNGNPVMDKKKYQYKLDWLDKLKQFSIERLKLEEPLILLGDFNVIPEDIDCYDIKAWQDDALALPEVRSKFRALCNLGFTEAIRNSTDEQVFTFWDFQKGAWQKNHGIRIDHFLLSPEAAKYLVATSIDKHTRGWEKPSDHVPVKIELDLEKNK